MVAKKSNKAGKGICRKLTKAIGYTLYLGIVVVLLLELCYRFYVVDFYGANLAQLNPGWQENETARSILLIGDSFSAQQDSYVHTLRDNFPERQLINSAVPGTCLAQHRMMLSKRLTDHQPATFIYQIYLGNDLLEYRHPTANTSLSWARRSYWWVSDRLRVLAYLNARLPALRRAVYDDIPKNFQAKQDAVFSLERYSLRTRLHIQAEPAYLQQTLLLGEYRAKDVANYFEELGEMLDLVPDSCQLIILLLPAHAQLGAPYTHRYAQLGGDTLGVPWSAKTEYPFKQALRQLLDSHDGRLLDPLPYFYQHPDKDQLYFPNDPHLSPYGQAELGHWLINELDNPSSN